MKKKIHQNVRTADHMTFDAEALRVIDSAGTQRGISLGGSFTTHDGRTVDSTGAFLVGELERLDQTIHAPLADVTWSRDVDLREDVTIADEVSSYTQSSFASPGGLGVGAGIGNGKAWIGKNTDQVAGVNVDISKTPQPLRPWGLELKWTILELESSIRLGRPVDAQKLEGLKLKHQMDVDEMVYIGDTSTGDTGLVNNSKVTNVNNLPNGVSGSPLWSTKTPDEILADVNFMLNSVWENSAYAVMPERLLLPPKVFGYLSTQKVSAAGNMSILKYIQENSLLTTSGRGKLEIFPCKWLVGAGVGGTIGIDGAFNRAMVYTKDKDRVRYPMTMLQRTPVQFQSIYHLTTYYARLGVMEVVYEETIGYFDGL